MLWAWAFAIVGVVTCCLAAIAIFPITQLYMARREAIERDGLARGVYAPTWPL
jgi:hypothetical protein